MITEDAIVTTLDEATQSIFDSLPDLYEAFKPIKGESTTSEILSLVNGVMQYKTKDLGDMVVTSTLKK